MTVVRIVERFEMDLGDVLPERDSWFLDYVLRSPGQAGKHLTAGWLALSSLLAVYDEEDMAYCWEAFGGMGAQALMARRIFDLKAHVVNEYNAEAINHLKAVLPGSVYPVLGDSYANPNIGADLVVLDFGDLTAWRTREGEKHRSLLDSVFRYDPKAVVFTDIACRYLHLHRERYESLLGTGTCGSYETYLGALLDRLHGLYGYRLVRGYYDRWSAVMALVPDDVHNVVPELLPTPDSPVGLTIVSSP